MLLWNSVYRVRFINWLLIEQKKLINVLYKKTNGQMNLDHIIQASILAYIIVGISCVCNNNITNIIPEWYAMLTLYLFFKWIFNYRKCSISYYEFKLRGVKKEEGYLYQFLEKLIDFRYSKKIYVIIIFQMYILNLYFRKHF